MGIVLFRIDDRLIHGQVVEGWFRTVHPDLVVVADDEAAGSEFQRTLMEMVVPYGVRTEILPVLEATRRCMEGAYVDCRGIFLFRSPKDVLTALNAGLSIQRLNLGGLHSDGETRSLGRGVLVSEPDLQDLKKILGFGVHIMVRPVPSEPAVDLQSMV